VSSWDWAGWLLAGLIFLAVIALIVYFINQRRIQRARAEAYQADKTGQLEGSLATVVSDMRSKL
jgi:hypothetical protein